MATTPVKTQSRTPVASPQKPASQFTWLQPKASTVSASPMTSARTVGTLPAASPYAWMTPATKKKVNPDDKSRIDTMLEKLGVTDKNLGSRNVFNANPTGASTATFGDPNASTNPLFSRVVPHPAETVKAAKADPFAWLHPTPVAAGKVVVPTPNDPALASRGTTGSAAAPAVSVAAQGSVYQDPNITGGLAQSVNSLNASQEEQAALQQQWKERLFNIAFGYGSDIGTDSGLLNYSKSRDALALLGSSFGTGKPGGASFRVPSLDIAGMMNAKAKAVSEKAARDKATTDAATLYWAQSKVNHADYNPWTNESVFDRDLRHQESLRNAVASGAGLDISKIR